MAMLSGILGQALNRPGFQDFSRQNEEFEARKREKEQIALARQQQMQIQKQQIEDAFNRRKALQGIAGQVTQDGAGFEDMLKQLAVATGDPSEYINYKTSMEKIGAQRAAVSDPAAVREWQVYNTMTPEDQQRYLQMKRADQIMNLGGQMAVRSPTGGIQESYTVTPKITETPEYQAMQTSAKETAKTAASRQTELAELEATYPQLVDTVNRLSDLGKKATYTKLGQTRDIALREAGLPPTGGAIARKEYESLVNNQILPLLRQTFGAAFTEKEGEQLRKTLGDVNATPEEKDAVLRSFIQQKKAQIETLKRQTGAMETGGGAVSWQEYFK